MLYCSCEFRNPDDAARDNYEKHFIVHLPILHLDRGIPPYAGTAMTAL